MKGADLGGDQVVVELRMHRIVWRDKEETVNGNVAKSETQIPIITGTPCRARFSDPMSLPSEPGRPWRCARAFDLGQDGVRCLAEL